MTWMIDYLMYYLIEYWLIFDLQIICLTNWIIILFIIWYIDILIGYLINW